MSVATREMGSVCRGNGEIDHVSKELVRMTPLLAGDAVALTVVVEKTRDGVTTTKTLMVTRSGNVSVEKL
jgi:hypothetical protein